jgi:hypothetical protein
MNNFSLAGFQEAIRGLFTAVGPGKQPKTPGKKSGKTRRGAKHRVGMHKLSRAIFNMSPAEYRRQHKGVITITPNYLKKHPAPRARNVQ